MLIQGLEALRRGKERASVAPIQTALAFVAIYGGFVAVIHFGVTVDALDLATSHHWKEAFSAAYLVGGILMLAGILSARANIEAGGVIITTASLMVRGIAFVVVLGWGALTLNAVVFYVAFAASLIERLRTLARGDLIIRVRRGAAP